MTSQGHAYGRLRRAILSKNVAQIDAASREVGRVGLDDALRILTVYAEKGDERFERASVRFAARIALERNLSPSEARQVLALAEALPRSPETVSLLLRPFCGS